MRTDLESELRLGYVHLNRPSSTSQCPLKTARARRTQWFTLLFVQQDVQGEVLGLNAFLDVELKGDIQSALVTLWDETFIAIEKGSEHEFFEFLYHRQLKHSVQLNNAMAVYEKGSSLTTRRKKLLRIVKDGEKAS